MTDLKKICPNSTIGESRIEITEDEVISLAERWTQIDKEYELYQRNKIISWSKSKDKIIN